MPIDPVMSNPRNETFTDEHLEVLRREFSAIERIDPESPTFRKMSDLLDALDDVQLRQFADAGIKFVSLLARGRLIQRQQGVR